MSHLIEKFASSTILAYQNPYHSVKYIEPSAFNQSCDQLKEGKIPSYFGVKETFSLEPMKQALLQSGFIFHTIDQMAAKGRAIDTTIINPVTGRMMTGSSSGTAVNVFLGINDIGIGSDGGGSVLAPAMSLQLYGMIHPDFPIQNNTRISTDGLRFSASSGIIMRNFSTLEKVLEPFNISFVADKLKIAVEQNCSKDLKEQLAKEHHEISTISFPELGKERKTLINWLNQQVQIYDVILSVEGPVDAENYGDSILGSLSEENKKKQENSGKGLLRIVNMLDLVGITIPYSAFGSGLLIVGKPEKTNQLLALAKGIEPFMPELVQRYFQQE